MSKDIVQAVSPYGCDETVERLKAALAAGPLRLVAHINGQANAAKMGLSAECDQILEVFRPDLAVRVWAACKAAGIDIPLRLHIYATDNDTMVAYRRPSRVFAPYHHRDLDAMGAELDTLFAQIVERAAAG
ncbi:DUF302 domain-containing protein [Acidiferrobacter sp.]|uniref:DUF302 domain-containing protein n=1 Tax=Acidiferrobacter sp. TaxID=1872107 RepID=UPI002606C851|nr:DUF302 domain-containing protein [Acidiferrobacter sp.]